MWGRHSQNSGGQESAWSWLTSGKGNGFYRPAAPHGVKEPSAEVYVVGLGTKMTDLVVCAPIRGHHRRQQEQSSHFCLCSCLLYTPFLVTSAHSIVTSAKRRIAFSGSLNTCVWAVSCERSRRCPRVRSDSPKHYTAFHPILSQPIYADRHPSTHRRHTCPPAFPCDLHNHGHRRTCRIQPPLRHLRTRPHACVQ